MGRENGSKERRGDGMSGMHRGAGWTGERRNYGPAVKIGSVNGCQPAS